MGQQVTLAGEGTPDTNARITLMMQRAATAFTSKVLGAAVTECDLVVTGGVDGADPHCGSSADDRERRRRSCDLLGAEALLLVGLARRVGRRRRR